MVSVATSVATQPAEEKPPRGYHERVATGWCAYGACERRADGWPEPVHHYCQRHRTKVQAKQRKQRAARRAGDSGAGKCVRCRKPSKTYRCPACRLLDGCDLASVSVATGVATDKIAAATRKDPDGRTRYHGQQRRGQQTHAQLNEQDLAMARYCWGRFEGGVANLDSDYVKQLHRHQVEKLKVAIASFGERLSGHIDDILERLGHFKQRHGRRDGE